MGMMEARSPRQIRDKFKDLYQTVLIANWKVWPAAQVSSANYFFFLLLLRSEILDHSSSISVIHLLPTVSRSRKPVEFFGHCICLF